MSVGHGDRARLTGALGSHGHLGRRRLGTVLHGTEAEVAALVDGLLAQGVRVYEEREGIAGVTRRSWERMHQGPPGPEPPEEAIEFTGECDWPRVDAEFEALCGMQTPGERAALRESITEHGCRDPLVVWEEREILLDGHNRPVVCRAVPPHSRSHCQKCCWNWSEPS